MNQTSNKITSFETKEEFEKLFHSFYSELCSYSNMFLKDLEASEEVVQETFVKLWENRKSLNIKSSFHSYLFRAVRNGCLNVIKHEKIKDNYKVHNENEIKNRSGSLDEEIDASELETKIRESIDLLPMRRRKAFIMSRYEGLKYKEIAEKLNISIKTVENQIGKALKFLKSELSEYMTVVVFLSINLISLFI